MKPKGIAMRPRPAAGIAHMGRPRSPIALADGGSVLDNILNVGGSALAGATGAAAADYANTGRPTPIAAKAGTAQDINLNRFAIPSISRTPTSNGGVAQAVTGYQAWPGMTAPTTQGQGFFGNYSGTPATTGAPSVSTGIAPTGAMISGGNGPHSASAAGMTLSGDPNDMISQILSSVGVTKGYARGGMVDCGYAGGGQIAAPQPQAAPADGRKRLFFAAVQALQGKVPNPQAILEAFVKAWGPQALQELKQHIMSGQVPGQASQPNQGLKGGGHISGPGDGMSDQVPARAGQTPIDLSVDEYVVPADAVAMLGNGSSSAGAKKLDHGIARLRQMKYGHSKQPPALKAGENPILD